MGAYVDKCGGVPPARVIVKTYEKKQQLLKCGARITRKHVSIIRRAAKRLKVSEAEVVRRAIEALA